MLWGDFFCNQMRQTIDDKVTAHSRRHLLSTTAFAQSAPPKVGNKPPVRVKPKEPTACKLVGTVRGTKLWAGDCVGVELLKGPTETPEPAGQKE